MATVCKWLGFYLCMRDTPKPTDHVHPDMQIFDAVIVWKETQKEKTGGMAYEMILEPAKADSAPRPLSPPKERPLSQEIIVKKLKDAEERRLTMEAAKLASIAKDKERLLEANQRIQELNTSFSKEAERRLSQRLDTMMENKTAQTQAVQERLREHAQRVEEVRKSSEKYIADLRERIDRKMEMKKGKREAQLQSIQSRIRDHEKQIHKAIQEVQQASDEFSKSTEEKLMQKMEISIKNREEQLKALFDRLQDHEKHIQDVRQNKLNQSLTGDGSAEKASS